jgi:hypothetical protein
LTGNNGVILEEESQSREKNKRLYERFQRVTRIQRAQHQDGEYPHDKTLTIRLRLRDHRACVATASDQDEIDGVESDQSVTHYNPPSTPVLVLNELATAAGNAGVAGVAGGAAANLVYTVKRPLVAK